MEILKDANESNKKGKEMSEDEHTNQLIEKWKKDLLFNMDSGAYDDDDIEYFSYDDEDDYYYEDYSGDEALNDNEILNM